MEAPRETVKWDFAVSDDFAKLYVTPVAKRSFPTTPIDPDAPITDLIIRTKDGVVHAHDTHGRIDEGAFWADEEDLATLTNSPMHIP